MIPRTFLSMHASKLHHAKCGSVNPAGVPQRPMARNVPQSVEHAPQALLVRATYQGSLQMTANVRLPSPSDVPTT
jgi:hypothetical protein